MLVSKELKYILINNTKIVLCFHSVVSLVKKLPWEGSYMKSYSLQSRGSLWNQVIILSFDESLQCLCKEIPPWLSLFWCVNHSNDHRQYSKLEVVMCNSLVSWAKKASVLCTDGSETQTSKPQLEWGPLCMYSSLQTVRGLIFRDNLNWHIIPGTFFVCFLNQQLCLLVSLSSSVWIRQVAGGRTVTLS